MNLCNKQNIERIVHIPAGLGGKPLKIFTERKQDDANFAINIPH